MVAPLVHVMLDGCVPKVKVLTKAQVTIVCLLDALLKEIQE